MQVKPKDQTHRNQIKDSSLFSQWTAMPQPRLLRVVRIVSVALNFPKSSLIESYKK